MAHYVYQPQGTCSKLMQFDINDGKISNFKFKGGCPGNLTAIRRLIEGEDAKTVAQTLKGIQCGFRPTSCGDQLAKAILKALRGDLKPEE